LQRALEAAGVEFLAGNGVRLSRQVDAKPSGGTPDATKKPAAGKRAPAPKAKALPMGKEAQIRALREQGAQ